MSERIPALKSVMTPFPHSIDVGGTVRQARSMMAKLDIRHLPVKEGNALVGVITDWDIARALGAGSGRTAARKLRVRDVMATDPYVVDLNQPLENVLLHLANEPLGCALIVRHGRLAGILTATDGCRIFGEYLRSLRGSGDGNDAA